MKRILLTFTCVMLILSGLLAQRRNGLIGHRTEKSSSFVFLIGPSYLQGDPFGSWFNSNFYNGTNFSTAVGFREDLDENNLGYKVLLHYGNYSGEDGLLKQHESNTRYYSFRSNVFEFTGRLEYTMTFGTRYKRTTPNSVYGFVGLGALLSTVTFPTNTALYKLTNFTNGVFLQNTTSTAFAPVFPMGIGYKYELSKEISIGAEVGGQFVTSDYIDGYKGTADPNNKSGETPDTFLGLSFTLYYKIQ